MEGLAVISRRRPRLRVVPLAQRVLAGRVLARAVVATPVLSCLQVGVDVHTGTLLDVRCEFLQELILAPDRRVVDTCLLWLTDPPVVVGSARFAAEEYLRNHSGGRPGGLDEAVSRLRVEPSEAVCRCRALHAAASSPSWLELCASGDEPIWLAHVPEGEGVTVVALSALDGRLRSSPLRTRDASRA